MMFCRVLHYHFLFFSDGYDSYPMKGNNASFSKFCMGHYPSLNHDSLHSHGPCPFDQGTFFTSPSTVRTWRCAERALNIFLVMAFSGFG